MFFPAAILLPAGAASMIATAMGLGIVLVACMFVVAYVFQSQQLMALAKEELAALIFSAILVLFWIGSDSTLNTLVSGLLQMTIPPQYWQGMTMTSQGYTKSHIDLAVASMDVMIARLVQQYKSLYFF